MGTPAFENLDLACAKNGKEIAEKPSKEQSSKELEKLITDSLAVVEEQGVYALFLFLQSQNGAKKENAKNLSDVLFGFLKKVPVQKPLISDSGVSQKGSSSDVFSALKDHIAEDLDKLLLAQNLLRQTLIYARYHARMRDEEPEKQEETK
jgi:hypothetical protein